jgi:hypothetical protein
VPSTKIAGIVAVSGPRLKSLDCNCAAKEPLLTVVLLVTLFAFSPGSGIGDRTGSISLVTSQLIGFSLPLRTAQLSSELLGMVWACVEVVASRLMPAATASKERKTIFMSRKVVEKRGLNEETENN